MDTFPLAKIPYGLYKATLSKSDHKQRLQFLQVNHHLRTYVLETGIFSEQIDSIGTSFDEFDDMPSREYNIWVHCKKPEPETFKFELRVDEFRGTLSDGDEKRLRERCGRLFLDNPCREDREELDLGSICSENGSLDWGKVFRKVKLFFPVLRVIGAVMPYARKVEEPFDYRALLAAMNALNARIVKQFVFFPPKSDKPLNEGQAEVCLQKYLSDCHWILADYHFVRLYPKTKAASLLLHVIDFRDQVSDFLNNGIPSENPETVCHLNFDVPYNESIISDYVWIIETLQRDPLSGELNDDQMKRDLFKYVIEKAKVHDYPDWREDEGVPESRLFRKRIHPNRQLLLMIVKADYAISIYARNE